MKQKPADNQIEILERKISQLQFELAEREKDLAVFRQELQRANSQLESLVGRLARDLKAMAQIQRSLVPTEFPNIPGFEFSTKFVPGTRNGGDYFDIFEHDDKLRFGVLVAHSSGYVVSALLLSVLLKIAGQIEARRGTPPDDILRTLIREIGPGLQPSDSASIFYGLVDRRRFEFSFCGLGGTVVLHHRFSTGDLQRLDVSELPLKTGVSPQLETQTVSLNPRDRLVFCTEGILQSVNASGEQFGEERLYSAILGAPKTGVHELRNEILLQLQRFSGEIEPPVDLTVVVMEVKDHVIKLAKQDGLDSLR